MNCPLSIIHYQLFVANFALTITYTLRKVLFIVLLFVNPLLSYSQGEYNIWHFGNHAGIDFNSGTAVAIYGPDSTREGTATICDASGNLLFSTDGVTVYNATGAIMGTGLYGSYTTTQSALIVPFPGSISMYYIFTADCQGAANGLCYSTVDMSLNGGLGGLVSINISLVTPVNEKITAVRNSNGTDYWVITRKYFSSEFYTYPVTASGVGSPVITSIAPYTNEVYQNIGYLKSSHNGQKLIYVQGEGANYKNALFDFNTTTGVISNYLLLACYPHVYGACFSPDDTKLYISNGYNANLAEIRQYDLTQPNFQNTPYTVLGQFPPPMHGALELAPDGKIYCARWWSNKIGVVEFPNLAGAACSYNDTAFTLLTGTESVGGLPNNIDTYFPAQPCALTISTSVTNFQCDSSTGAIHLSIAGGVVPVSYSWSNGDTTQNTANLSAGNYVYTVTDGYGCTISDTVTVIQLPSLNIAITSLTDTLSCNGEQNGIIDIEVSGGIASSNYEWSTGATTEDLTGLTAGTYSVTVTDSAGCLVSDTFMINEPALLNTTLIFSTDTIFCNAVGGTPPYQYDWSTGETTSSVTDIISVQYTITVTDAHGCIALDTIFSNSAETIFSEINFTISPNPTSEQLTITSNQLTDCKITIYDLVGRAVFLETLQPGTSHLDVRTLSSGIYLLEIRNNKGETAVRKMVKVE